MINIIPKPRAVLELSGAYSFSKGVLKINFDPERVNIKQAVACILQKESVKSEKGEISFIYSSKLSAEEYLLKVHENEIEIFYSDYGSVVCALSSLRQITNDKGEVSCCEISDKPLYSYRGLQLDESRHFFGKETVKKLLDFMALYKLNRFHWHLSDDQGWRIEIEKYPLLTEIGSKRVGSQLHNWKCKEMDEKICEGYYTKDEIRQIVAYAKARNIEIIPEIDFPAHSAAAIASYNNLACRNIPAEVPNYFGGLIPKTKGVKDWNRCLCLGDDEVLNFVFDVIGEVAELFPCEYFHVGGDEAPTDEWRKCQKCQQRMKAEGLKNETALQGWFSNKLSEFLKSKGKTMIGWNEVLAFGNLDTDVVAQYWTPKKDKGVIDHLKKGGKVILSRHKYFYFDMLHTYCNPKDTYYFTAKTVGIKKKLEKGVLGVEGENWTEWTDEEDELFFKMTARALALSECAWSRGRDYSDFLLRYENNKALLEKMGINFGDDSLVLKRNIGKKRRLAKKIGMSLSDFDCEYEIDNSMK